MKLQVELGGYEVTFGVEHSGEVEGATDADVRRAVEGVGL